MYNPNRKGDEHKVAYFYLHIYGLSYSLTRIIRSIDIPYKK